MVSLSTGTWRSVPSLWIRWCNLFVIDDVAIYYTLSIFHILDWGEVWVWQKCFDIEIKGLLGKKHMFHAVDSLDCLRFWVAAANLEVSTAISDWEGGKLSELRGGQLWRIVIGRLSDLRTFHTQDRSALYRSNLINFSTNKTVREVAT